MSKTQTIISEGGRERSQEGRRELAWERRGENSTRMERKRQEGKGISRAAASEAYAPLQPQSSAVLCSFPVNHKKMRTQKNKETENKITSLLDSEWAKFLARDEFQVLILRNRSLSRQRTRTCYQISPPTTRIRSVSRSKHTVTLVVIRVTAEGQSQFELKNMPSKLIKTPYCLYYSWL